MTTALEHSETSFERDDASIREHLEALGLISRSAYKLWCRRNGFSMSLDKADEERDAELAALSQQKRPRDPGAEKRHDPHRAQLFRRIAAGECEREWLPQVGYCVRNLFRSVGQSGGGHIALLHLLLHLEEQGSLLLANVGLQVTTKGILELMRHHTDWVRDPADWTATSDKPMTQFRSLARHLIATYDVPDCLNAAWFEPNPNTAAVWQQWYKHVGGGQNIRTATKLPFVLTRRAAHDFMNSTSGYHPLMSLRLSQISGQVSVMRNGVREQLQWTLAANERLHSPDNADFWTSVINFIIANPMIEPGYVDPLVDYIQHRKFERQAVPQPDGSVRLAPPQHPLFSVKGRSMNKLVREVDDWHEHLSAEAHDNVQTWEPSGIGDFGLTEKTRSYGPAFSGRFTNCGVQRNCRLRAASCVTALPPTQNVVLLARRPSGHSGPGRMMMRPSRVTC